MNRDIIDKLRREYPKGTKIELIHMDDPQAPPTNCRGTVAFIDDAGTVHMNWDNGSGLGLIPGVDKYKIIGG